MRVLICGGRNYANRKFFNQKLNEIQMQKGTFDLIIQGGAKGADYLAHLYAAMLGIKEEVYNANWATYGKRAGPIRNYYMVQQGKPELVIAFPGGAGTEHMVSIAKKKGIEVIQFFEESKTTNFVEPSNEQ